MARESSRQADRRVREALDGCLLRMRQGEAVEACLVEHAELADALEPLLRAAAALSAAQPPPPRRLEAGRARLLAAAQTVRVAEAGMSVDDATIEAETREVAALDIALAARRASRVRNTSHSASSPSAAPLGALLDCAARLEADIRPLPAAPGGLIAGRARLLAAAATAFEAQSAGQDAAAAEALDAALAAVGADTAPTLAPETGALVAVVEQLRRQTLIPPSPSLGLAPGRERFLALAARAAEHHAAVASANARAARSARPSRLAGLNLLSVFGWGSATRLAMAAMAAVILFFGATQALETQAREALPGDPLYGIKRINESIDLALAALNADSISDLRADQARLRALEIEQLMALGREAESSIDGALLSYGRGASNDPFGTLGVRVPPRGDDTREFTYGWDARTSFEPGAWGSMSSVPRGSRIKLRVISARTPSGHALALAVRVLDQPDQPMTATATLSVTMPVTATGTPTTTRPILPTEPITPSPSPTARASATTIPLQPTQPLSPTATTTATPLPEPLPSSEPELARWALNRYTGLVIAKLHPDLWTLREDVSGEDNDFDLSLLPADAKAGINLGDLVEVAYRKGSSPRLVERMTLRASDRGCAEGRELGIVAALEADRITLSTGSSYSLPTDLARTPGLVLGATVTVLYRDCLGKRELLAISVEAGADARVTLEGRVQKLRQVDARTWRFELDTGERIEFGSDTDIRGMEDAVANGQYVEVTGSRRGDGVIVAERIDILEAAAPDPIPGDLPPATLAVPEPGATPDPPGR